jgi:hypothetical protein
MPKEQTYEQKSEYNFLDKTDLIKNKELFVYRSKVNKHLFCLKILNI